MLTMETERVFEAIKTGNLEKVRELMDKNPGLVNIKNKSGATPLLFALYAGRPEIAEVIEQRKPELDIFEAASMGNLRKVEQLTGKDSKLVQSYSDEGFTALQLAAYLGRRETVDFLLNADTEVNAVAKNPTGYTALTGAVARQHIEVARILLEKGADPNHSYEDGFTPLMEAAASGNLAMVQLLLAHGADPQIRRGGKTARDFALEKGQATVAELLKQHVP